MTPGMRWIAAGLVAVFSACGGVEDAVEDRADSAPAAEDDGTGSEPATSDGRGTLTVAGDAIESPGTHEVEIACQYSRSPGILVATAYGTTSTPGTLSLNVGAPVGGVPFEDGTYPGRFSYDEPRSDGRVLSHHGEIETTIDVLDGPEGRAAEIRARGGAEGAEVELSGRCAVMGAG